MMRMRCLNLLAVLLLLAVPGLSCAGDLFYPSGTYYTSQSDLKVAARSVPMSWERTYRSNRMVKTDTGSYDYSPPTDGPLGYGWQTPFTTRILRNHFVSSDGGTMTDVYVGADGRYFYFNHDSSDNYEPDKKNGYVLSKTTSGYQMQEVGGNASLFNSAGQLTAVRDPRGRSATVSYDGLGNVVSVADVVGRTVFSFDYWLFSATDLSVMFSLIPTLQGDPNSSTLPVSQFLWGALDAATKQAVTDPLNSLPKRQAALVQGLNTVIQHGSIYDPVRFAKVSLRTATQALVGQSLSGESLIRFNRMLLEDAYPQSITQNKGSHIHRVTDVGGRSLDYSYDGYGNLTQVSHSGDLVASYVYNAYHGLTSESNALGESWSVGYLLPTEGVLSRITNPAGQNLVLKTDFQNRIYTITGYTGNTRRFILDGSGNVVSDSDIQDGVGTARQTVQILPDGTRKSIDSAGNAVVTKLDQWNNTTSSTDAEGNTTSYTYNAQNKPLTVTDPTGVVTAYEYDASGTSLTKITRAKDRPEQVVTSFAYNDDGDLASTSTDSATTGFEYNSMGLPITVTDPLGNKSTLEYDAVGNVTASTDANQNRSEFSYDWRGNLLAPKDPLGNVTTYSYNTAGRLTGVKDALGRSTSTATDYAGKVTMVTPPIGTAKSFEYDGNGNLVKTTEGDAVTVMTYDNQNRLYMDTDPEGNSTVRVYDNSGCTSCGASQTIPKQIIDPLGHATTNSFDKVGRVTGVTDPLGNLTSIVYDPAGRVALRTDANRNAASYAYDSLGRVMRQTDANGGVTSFAYDARGNLTALTDPEMNATTFAYDLAGRKTKETRPEGEATSYDYYPNGLLKSVRDAKGQLTGYLYDKGNRLVETDFADGIRHTFSYDAAGNMTGYASPDVSAIITYDAGNRKTSESVTMGGFTKGYSYAYDGKGNKANFTTPEGTTYSYTYNKNSQPTQITTPVGNIVLGYQWIRQTRVTLPNGIVTDYAYNDTNWLTQIKANRTSVTPPSFLASATYGFDNVGNITGKTTEAGSHVYGYDSLYQLTGATIPALPQEAYSYDKVGNRKTSVQTQGSWSYNKDNELVSYNGTSLTYDANGNTVTKSEGGVPTTYNYGATDRLTSVQLPDGSTAAYTYDPFGRRIRKQVGTEVTYFLYADEGVIGEYDASGSFNKGYGWRPNGIWGTDPVFMVEDGEFSFYHNDHLGTPQKMTDIDGDVVWSTTYGAFGNATVDPASTVTSNLRFPGQYFDEETGLHYNWNRYYVSVTGRYLQSDPLGFEGEDSNLYRFVSNSPVNFIDPFGLKLCKIVLPGLGEVYLDNTLVPLIEKWIELNAKTGIEAKFTEAFRTSEYQSALSKNKNAITPAKKGSSLHEAGFAVDIKWSLIPDNLKNQVVQNAKDAGLDWGGTFKKKSDPVHFYHDPGNRAKRIADAQKEYKGGNICDCKR
jgi:RHS repeat-associated protein